MTETRPFTDNGSPNAPQPPNAAEDKRRGRHRGPMQGLFWGMLLILLGILFFVRTQGGVTDDNLWQYLLIGLGAIFIVDGLVHYARRAAYGITGRLIAGAVLIVIGLAFINGWDNWWPLALVTAGVVILASYFVRSRR
jgi:uncharacterized membrane protein HdeD (DUF308 family)